MRLSRTLAHTLQARHVPLILKLKDNEKINHNIYPKPASVRLRKELVGLPGTPFTGEFVTLKLVLNIVYD